MKAIYVILFSLFIISCKNTNDKVVVIDEKQEIIDSMKLEIEKNRIIDSMKTVEADNAKKREIVIVNQSTPQNVTPTTTKQRKKWSGAAKGAVIGAGVGAVTGAIISKKKGEGAIIGGLAGAGLGAGTGAIIDDSKKK
ncbi:YMGG-like glycine zipper-containing protein [Flavobacterium sp.]